MVYIVSVVESYYITFSKTIHEQIEVPVFNRKYFRGAANVIAIHAMDNHK